MRNLATRLALAVGLALLLVAAPAAAQEQSGGDGTVDVIKVSGHLDPILVDFVERSVETAERDGAVAVVLRLDSPGAVVGDQRLDELIETIGDADVPVGVWVGPSGAQAGDDAYRLVEAADFAGMAPGSKLDLGNERVGATTALERDIVDFPAPTVGDFIVSLPGVESREIRDGDEIRRQPITQTRFLQLPLLSQQLHTVASPAVAYLLFVIGMALIVFELYTAGIGIAGVVGAVCFALGCFGLTVLPTEPVGVALLVFAMFAFAVDVQTGVPRVWTGIAIAAFVAGSLLLYDGITLSWITLLVAFVGMGLAMLAGMPAMVRTRFSTPTIGREWMIGEEGTARTAISPDGTALVRGVPWRARTNRSTPLAAGEPLRVAAIEGLVLEVEPLVGAAIDYRERRSGVSAQKETGAPEENGASDGP